MGRLGFRVGVSASYSYFRCVANFYDRLRVAKARRVSNPVGVNLAGEILLLLGVNIATAFLLPACVSIY